MFECQNIFLLILIYYIKILFTKFVNMQLLKHCKLKSMIKCLHIF